MTQMYNDPTNGSPSSVGTQFETHYFERKALLPKQKIVEKRQDGSLVISSSAWSYNQIAPIVQYWIPNIRVLSPCELDTYIRKNLTSWLDQTSSQTESEVL